MDFLYLLLFLNLGRLEALVNLFDGLINYFPVMHSPTFGDHYALNEAKLKPIGHSSERQVISRLRSGCKGQAVRFIVPNVRVRL